MAYLEFWDDLEAASYFEANSEGVGEVDDPDLDKQVINGMEFDDWIKTVKVMSEAERKAVEETEESDEYDRRTAPFS